MGRGEALHVRRARGRRLSPALPCPSLAAAEGQAAASIVPSHSPNLPETRRAATCKCGIQLVLCAEPQLGEAGSWSSPEGGSPLVLFLRGRTAVGAGWAEARPGSRAVDHGLTGIWGNWCQSFPSACCAEAWWVLGTGTLLVTLAGGRERPPAPSSRCRTCWGR